MSRLILVKHAEPDVLAGTPPPEWTLSASGRRQAEGLAERLRGHRPASLHCSDEPKAVQTAELLGRRLRLPVGTRRGLRENDRSSLPFSADPADFRARMEEFFRRPSDRTVGHESADEAHARMRASLEGLVAAAGEGSLVVVSHGAVISLVVARANDLEAYPFWVGFGFTSFVVLDLPSFALKEVVHPLGR